VGSEAATRLPEGQHGAPGSQWDALQWLRQAGFRVNPHCERCPDLAAVEAFFLRWDMARRSLDYATDGGRTSPGWLVRSTFSHFL